MHIHAYGWYDARALVCVCLVSVHPTLKRKNGDAPAPSRRRPLPPCLIEGERGKRRKLWLEAADETTGRAGSFLIPPPAGRRLSLLPDGGRRRAHDSGGLSRRRNWMSDAAGRPALMMSDGSRLTAALYRDTTAEPPFALISSSFVRK